MIFTRNIIEGEVRRKAPDCPWLDFTDVALMSTTLHARANKEYSSEIKTFEIAEPLEGTRRMSYRERMKILRDWN